MEPKAWPDFLVGEHAESSGKRSWTSRWHSSSRLDVSKETSTGEDFIELWDG